MLTVSLFLSPLYEGRNDGHRLAMHFELPADDHLAACELLFAVCNSYPDEMHCDESLTGMVGRYRDAKHRSMSVDDIVVVHDPSGDAAYRCAAVGFEACSLPTMRRVARV